MYQEYKYVKYMCKCEKTLPQNGYYRFVLLRTTS